MQLLVPIVLVVALAAVALLALRRHRRDRPVDGDVTVRQLDDIVAENARSAAGTLGATRAMLAVISEIGGDTRAETDVTFYLDIPEKADAERVVEVVGSKGVTARISDVKAPPYAVLVSTRMIPSELAIEQWTHRLDTIASAYGGRVDGWEAAIDP